MDYIWRRAAAAETGTVELGRDLALWLSVGDLVALRGPVGVGKSVLARAIIRALATSANGATVEVPSPTYTLVESYRDLRLPVAHFDLYRIEDPGEVAELGFEDAMDEGVVLVEWPEKLGGFLVPDYLEITLAEQQNDDGARDITLCGHGAWAARLERAQASDEFVARSGWAGTARHWLKGDASTRAYQRLVGAPGSAILMDAPAVEPATTPGGGKSYATIAGLATDVAAFLAVNGHLRGLGLSAPRILNADAERGFVLLEDFGVQSFEKILGEGGDLTPPYRAALAALARLQETAPPGELPYSGGTHKLPKYNLSALLAEVELLVQWFWPMHFGRPCPPPRIAEYRDIWSRALSRLEAPSVLVLRDFHSPNLYWLPKRIGAGRIGIIDHQDAAIGHPAFDLMSLAQDARHDLPTGFGDLLIAEYRTLCGLGTRPDDAFGFACALLGAQRGAKILGVFARLASRDQKPGYLAHIPRVARYLAGNLAHPDLRALQAWFDDHIDLSALVRRLAAGA